MQKKFLRVISLAVIAGMLSSFVGCSNIEEFLTLDHNSSSKKEASDVKDEEDDETSAEKTARPTETEADDTDDNTSDMLEELVFPDHSWTYEEIHPERENGTVSGEEAVEILNNIETAAIADSISSSYLAYVLYFDDPSVFGVDSCEPTWGSVDTTDEEREENLEEINEYLDQLYTIDVDSLETDDRIFYDKLVFDLEESAYVMQFNGLGYVEGIFNPLTGPQCELMFLLTVFSFDTVEDVENYIAFVADVDRYYDEMCEFEEKRAEYGFAYSDESYEAIAVSFDNLASQEDDCFLYEDFENRLDNIEGLSDEDRAELIEAHENVMHNSFFPEFTECAERMRALKGSGTEDVGVCNYEGGIAYYDYHFRTQCNTSMSVTEAAEEIEEAIGSIMTNARSLAFRLYSDQAALNEYMDHDYSVGDCQANLDFLYEVITDDYPELVDHSYVIIDVPEALEENFSPAAYLASHLDNFDYNTIMINNSCETDTFGTTCAHEGYPGHMFQSVYTRSHTNHPYMYLADSVGYAEGWAQYVECMSTKYFASSDEIASLVAMDTELNLLLMARLDIGIHYEGWNLEECSEHASEILGSELSADNLAELYNLLVLDPCYAAKYGVGFLRTVYIISDAQSNYENASLRDIHTAYLDCLTGTYEQIERNLNVMLEEEFG